MRAFAYTVLNIRLKLFQQFRLESKNPTYFSRWSMSNRNITIKKQRDEMLEMLQYLNRRGGLGLDIHNKIEQLIKQATEL